MQISIKSSLFITVQFLFGATALAQNKWLYPDPNQFPTYNNIDTVNASWSTDYEQARLVLWCSDDGNKTYNQHHNDTVAPISNSLVQLKWAGQINPSECHFDVANSSNVKDFINSGDFKIQIEGSGKPAQTWSPTSPSATPNSTASASASSKPHHEDSSGGGLSSGAEAGIAAGVVAGVFLAVGALFLWLRSRRRWRNAQLARHDGPNTMAEKEGLQNGFAISEMAAPETAPTVPVETDGRMVAGDVSEVGGQPVVVNHVMGELEGSGGLDGEVVHAR